MIQTDRNPSEGRVTMVHPGPWSTFTSSFPIRNAEHEIETPTGFSPLPLPEDNGSSYSQASITSRPVPQEYPELIKEYGERRMWEWSEADGDFVVKGQDGKSELFSKHQMIGIPPPAPANPDPNRNIQHPDGGGDSQPRGSSPARGANSIPKPTVSFQLPRPAYEEPLGPEFSAIAKPKRFFCTGRVFAAVWFEPSTEDAVQQQPKPRAWSNDCPAFRGQKPIAKIRWFVVVRRRLHHSLCFTVTTYAGKPSGRTNRGRTGDHAVLFRANVLPEPPYDDEDITREPIGIIIEDAEYYISPTARLDCGRIYTVEDHLKVAKVGRVHPNSLSSLEQYYRDIVL